MTYKFVSGGQTGVDRAALDVAIEHLIAYGGWCPKGRIDENGIIPNKYVNLQEIAGEFENDVDNYAMRTKWNIKDSDGTLILVPCLPLPNNIKDGTLLTLNEVKNCKKPYLIINLSDDISKNVIAISSWVRENKLKTINIAGPRESSSPNIYSKSYNLLTRTIPYMQEKLTDSCEKRCRL